MNLFFLTLLCALVFGVSLTNCAAHVGGSAGRCLCHGTMLKSVKPGSVRTFRLFPPSASCSQTEILLTVKRKGMGKGMGKRWVCLDPSEKQGQMLISSKGLKRQNKKRKY
ncbi:chemokine (C-X-C motif) ligand 20 [Myxocyprinus asiaticus]|uniref:chemokine (C-X-C motif) ligand 20 n=1 Tax=Myxocyprinus asiaticus TaxID=70543 RepID=UPI002223703F|nr:chemokine (C-X-C motif) ligand 20 [Myxocyprinus asiaticus]